MSIVIRHVNINVKNETLSIIKIMKLKPCLQCTLLQKLQKFEVEAHSVEIQESNCHLILLEINFATFESQKFPFFNSRAFEL